MDVFSVASRHVSWLQNRQKILAENIANSDTPGYKVKDLSAFEIKGNAFSAALQVTNAKHFPVAGNRETPDGAEIVMVPNLDVAHSGNNVDVTRELKKVGESSFGVTFDVAITKTFHRLLMASIKG